MENAVPIESLINEEDRIVYTCCRGEMGLDDFKVYMAEVWGHMRYYGYNELFDASQGDWSNFDFSYLFTVAAEASKLGSLDPASRMAWLIKQGKQKELTDFYSTAKSVLPVNSRSLQAFYDRDEALQWLCETKIQLQSISKR